MLIVAQEVLGPTLVQMDLCWADFGSFARHLGSHSNPLRPHLDEKFQVAAAPVVQLEILGPKLIQMDPFWADFGGFGRHLGSHSNPLGPHLSDKVSSCSGTRGAT